MYEVYRTGSKGRGTTSTPSYFSQILLFLGFTSKRVFSPGLNINFLSFHYIQVSVGLSCLCSVNYSHFVVN